MLSISVSFGTTRLTSVAFFFKSMQSDIVR